MRPRQGDNVRYGIAPDKLYHSWLVYEQNDLDLRTLNAGGARIDVVQASAERTAQAARDAGREGVATGLYTVGTRPKEFEGMGEDDLVDFFTREATDGADDTAIRPDFLKGVLSAMDPAVSLHDTSHRSRSTGPSFRR